MDIREIILRNAECGPFVWINPRLINGFSREALVKKNKSEWVHGYAKEDEYPDNEDVAIVGYLKSCIQEMRDLEEAGHPVPDALKINTGEFLDSAVYMMTELRSSYAGTRLGFEQGFITSENCDEYLLSLRGIYFSFCDDAQLLDMLRDFILDQYKFGSLWDPESSFLNYLAVEGVEFLKYVRALGPGHLRQEA
jgi:hypothetical protein